VQKKHRRLKNAWLPLPYTTYFFLQRIANFHLPKTIFPAISTYFTTPIMFKQIYNISHLTRTTNNVAEGELTTTSCHC